MLIVLHPLHTVNGSCLLSCWLTLPDSLTKYRLPCCPCRCHWLCYLTHPPHRIPFAQPNQSPPTNFRRPVALGGSLYVCGDHRDSATFDAAIASGRRAAEALLAEAGRSGGVGVGSKQAVSAST
jgi:hypothetical protein